MSTAPATAPSFKTQLSYRELWALAYPIIAGGIGTNIVNVTDTAFLGRVSEVALGAAALGGILYYLMAIVAIASATGLQILIARRMGEGKPQAVGSILDHGLLINLALGLVLMGVLYATTGPLLTLAVSSPAVREATQTYLYGRGWGLPFIFLFWTFRGFYSGAGRPRVLIVATFTMAAVNVVLDYGLIFGHWGLPQWGVYGAGFASACAEATEALVPLAFFIFRGLPRQYAALRFRGMSWGPVRQLAVLSGPMVLQNALSMAAWFLFFVVMEHLGERQLAASNLARSLYMVAMIPGWGFAVAANTAVSNVIGQGKPEWVLMATRRTLALTFGFLAVLALLLLLLPGPLLRIYTQDADLIAETLPILNVVVVALLCFGWGMIPLNAVMGTGATRVSFAFEVINITLYLGLVVLIGRVLGGTMLQVWLVEPIYFFAMGAMSVWYLRSGRWRRLIV